MRKALFLVFLIFLGSTLWGVESSSREPSTLDYIWVLTCAALVFLMQAGFMALESGMARAKNSINIAIKNLADFILSVAGYWILGFGLMFGLSQGGLFGFSDFFTSIGNDPWKALFFVFQTVFAGTAATIDSGAVAERTKFAGYLIISFITCSVIYPIFGHWAWGGFLHPGNQGWLQRLGFLDFAGSTVVHSIGGWVALAGVLIVGPRQDKFTNGKPNKIPPHNLLMVYLGTFILFFGWFGFNGGSTLAATPAIAGILFNTVLGAAFGAISAGALSWIFSPNHHPEADVIANGLLGGLVSITAGCAWVETYSAALIGSIGGVIIFWGSIFLERVLKIDDVVGAIPVHGFCGIWGTLAIGFFITEDKLATLTQLSRWEQIGVQTLGVASAFLWAFPVALLFYYLIKVTIGIRVNPQAEEIGLNIAEHGASMSLIGLAHAMHKIRSLDIIDDNAKVPVEFGTEVGELSQYFNEMLDALRQERLKTIEANKQREAAFAKMRDFSKTEYQLRKTLQQQREEADTSIRQFSKQMESRVEQVSQKTHQMENLLKETYELGKKMDESFGIIVKTVGDLFNSFRLVESDTLYAEKSIDESVNAVKVSRSTVGQLSKVATKIGEMIDAISEISEQTRILSVNAAIEAARAGEAGKSFRVVANEVKRLAESTGVSGRQIVEYLRSIQENTLSTSQIMDKIASLIAQVESVQSRIRASVVQQRVDAGQVNEIIQKAKNNLSELTQGLSNVVNGAKTVSDSIQESLYELNAIIASQHSN